MVTWFEVKLGAESDFFQRLYGHFISLDTDITKLTGGVRVLFSLSSHCFNLLQDFIVMDECQHLAIHTPFVYRFFPSSPTWKSSPPQ